MIFGATTIDIQNQQRAIEQSLITALHRETDETTRTILVQMLGLAPSREAAQALIVRIPLSEPSDLSVIYKELGKMGEDALDLLILAIGRTQRAEQQVLYIGALGHVSSPRLVPFLDGWYDSLITHVDLDDKTRGLRIAMSKALKKTGYETLDVLPLLAKLLSDPASQVRSSAAQVMLDVLRHAYSE